MKLHLGSGKVHLKGWQNIDFDAPEADMHLDLREKLPFGNELISHIYNEHFIEHITREESVNLLKECYRVLRSDGVLRLSTPNLKFIAIAYFSRNISEWGDVSWQPETACRLMNEAMRLWGHQFVYDAEELVAVLTEAGFTSIQFVNYGKSDDKALIGLETRPFHHELIVEARKDVNVVSTHCTSRSCVDGGNEWLSEVNNAMLKQLDISQQTMSDQAACILNLKEQLESCEQRIIYSEAGLVLCNQHIVTLNAQHTIKEEQLAIRDQYIVDLTTHIHNLETELTNLRSSWYRKIKSAARRLDR